MVYKHADFKVNQIKNVARVTENFFVYVDFFKKKIFSTFSTYQATPPYHSYLLPKFNGHH